MILVVGFSSAFAISMPSNDAFDKGALGPAAGLLTSYEALLGAFHMSDYDNTETQMMFILFLFAVVIVMLNLLIAIMYV